MKRNEKADDPHQAPIQTETGQPGPPVVDLENAVPEDQAKAEEARATTVVGNAAVDDPAKQDDDEDGPGTRDNLS